MYVCVYYTSLQIGDRPVGGLTRAEVFELLDASFLKSDSVRLTVFYDAKALSQLPPHAKDNFYVRCVCVQNYVWLAECRGFKSHPEQLIFLRNMCCSGCR